MIPSYPAAAYITDIDWTGGELITSDPTVFSWSNVNPTHLLISQSSSEYAYHVEAQVSVDCQAGSGSSPSDLEAHIFFLGGDTMIGFGHEDNAAGQGWRAVYGGNVPRSITESYFSSFRNAAVDNAGDFPIVFELIQSLGGVSNTNVNVTDAMLTVIAVPTTGNSTSTRPLA